MYGSGGVGLQTASAASISTNIQVQLRNEMEDVVLVPGETAHIKVPVITKDIYMGNPDVSIKVTNSAGEKISGVKIKDIFLIEKDGTKTKNISCIDTTYIEFDVTTKDTMQIGRYYFNISFKALMEQFTSDDLLVPFSVDKELKKAELTLDKFSYKETAAVVGNKLSLTATVKNEGELKALSGYVSVDYGTTKIAADYSTKSIKIGDLAGGESKKLQIPIKILADAEEGTKVLKLIFTYKDADGVSCTDTAEVYIELRGNHDAPKIKYSSAKVSTAGELNPGDQFTVTANLANIGQSTAYNVKISLEGVGADTLIPNFTTDVIEVDNMDQGEKHKIKIPLIVSKSATSGNKALTIITKYQDASNVSYEVKTTVYPEVVANEKEESTEKKPSILISDVNQSPASPMAGDIVTLSFKIQNKGKEAAKELKLVPTNLTSDTFSPLSSEPYTYIEKLKAGASKQISMSFRLSDKIQEGYNTIELTYSYLYGKNGTDTGTAKINVLDVINDTESDSKSVPKIIVSNFSTDPEEIRASKEFQFKFDLLNTHSSVTAKNIKVTISQADNIFSVTSGSNSFYVDKIKAGETYSASIPLKVKADATTKAYPLVIKIEYEYDGEVASPVTGEVGEKVEETINLTAIENSRPNVDNIYMENWITPVVGQSSTLSFQFYNMGKSTLSNVRAKISGDFEKSDGTEYFIGNVEAGASEYVELDVTPLVAGEAKGLVTIIYEDSNGEELTLDKDFIATIMSQEETMGDMNMNVDIPAMNTEGSVKAPLVPTWAFVLIQVAILIVGMLVTRGIMIKAYKRKLEKIEEGKL